MYKSLHDELRNFHMKFSVKFTTSFQSSRFDWQLRNEIAQFVVNRENFKRTSETVCQKFCETHRKPFLGNSMNDNFKVPHVRGLN